MNQPGSSQRHGEDTAIDNVSPPGRQTLAGYSNDTQIRA
jgi:hypothetical protein